MIEKYRTRDDDLHPRERGLGAGAIGRTEREWSQLIAMLELAQRWHELIGEFTFEEAHPDGANGDEPGSASWRSNNSDTLTG